MFSMLRSRMGAPGLIAVIALIMALGGTALAKGLFTKAQEKKIAQIAKRYAGKPGALGPAGPAGSNGTNGKDGANGSPGAPGKSVVLVNEEPAGCENEEGLTYEVEGSGVENEVCNGSPWAAGGILPSKQTETGIWFGTGEFSTRQSLSFPIPLPSALDHTHTVGVPAGGPVPAECENTEHAGTASVSNPEADPGYLCAFAKVGSVLAFFNPAAGEQGAAASGAVLVAGTEFEEAQGTFAVTAP